MLSITIGRASLSLPDLVLPNYPANGLWVPEEGLQRPARAWNRTTATAPWLHGEVLVQAVLQQASLPFTLYAQAGTTGDLEDLQTTVDHALSQFSYPVSLNIDNAVKTWDADPADVAWGEVDSGMVAQHIAAATITIPVYPVAS